MNAKMNLREMKKNRLIKAAVIIGIFIFCFFAILISIPLVKTLGSPEIFRDFIESFGIFSPLIYIFLVVLQILLPLLPGEPAELVAGYAFGAFKGTLLCLFAESLGSIIVILIVKKYGRKVLEFFFSHEKIDSLKFLHTSKSKTLLYSIIFVMPGTPKDLLCYVAGLLDIDIKVILLVTTFGRIPSIITSTLIGGNLGDKEYLIAVNVLVVTLLITLLGVIIYRFVSVSNKGN